MSLTPPSTTEPTAPPSRPPVSINEPTALSAVGPPAPDDVTGLPGAVLPVALESLREVRALLSYPEAVLTGDLVARERFRDGLGAFIGSGATWIEGENSDFGQGFMRLAASADVSLDIGEPTGDVFVEFDLRAEGTSLGDSTKNVSFYLLPAEASGSANSYANSFFISDDDPAQGEVDASADYMGWQYRAGASFFGYHLVRRLGWHRIGLLYRAATRKFELYYEGRQIRGAGNAPLQTGGPTRFNILLGSAADSVDVANVRVITGESLGYESPVLIYENFLGGDDSAMGDDAVGMANRLQGQARWQNPTHSSLGTFVRTEDGLSAPLAKYYATLTTCGCEGEFEVEFEVPASGDCYAGVAFNCYETVGTGLGTEDAYGLLRYSSSQGASNRVGLFYGGTSAAFYNSDLLTGINRLRLVKEGVAAYVYLNDTLLGSVALRERRGLMGEEAAGVLVDGANGNALIRSFRYQGPRPQLTLSAEHGAYRSVLSQCTVRELYLRDQDLSVARNVFSGKGIQNAHRSQGEPSEGRAVVTELLLSAPNVRVDHQRGRFIDEQGGLGIAEVWVTRTRRGIYVSDRATVDGEDNNFGPDFDLNPAVWKTGGFRVTNGSGTYNYSWNNHTWTGRPTGQSSLPIAGQFLGSSDSLPIRATIAFAGISASYPTVAPVSKHKGSGDPCSFDVPVDQANITDKATYELACLYIFDEGESFDNSFADNLRASLGSPPEWEALTGSVKTDADGDEDGDGWNERRGWFEAEAFGGRLILRATLDAALPRAQFRIGKLTAPTLFMVNGAQLAFACDDLGDGSCLVTLSEDIPTGLLLIDVR